MNSYKKIALYLITGVLFVLPACTDNNIPFGPNDSGAYDKTREIQTSLNQAGFQVGGIESTPSYVCALPDKHEGEFEEYSFEIFAPFTQQEVVSFITEKAMNSLDIEPTKTGDGLLVALTGESGGERYSLTFVSKDTALFLATTPCRK